MMLRFTNFYTLSLNEYFCLRSLDRGSTFLRFNFHCDEEEINHYCGHTSLQINALAGMLLVVARVQSPKRNINAIDGW